MQDYTMFINANKQNKVHNLKMEKLKKRKGSSLSKLLISNCFPKQPYTFVFPFRNFSTVNRLIINRGSYRLLQIMKQPK